MDYACNILTTRLAFLCNLAFSPSPTKLMEREGREGRNYYTSYLLFGVVAKYAVCLVLVTLRDIRRSGDFLHTLAKNEKITECFLLFKALARGEGRGKE